MSSPDSYPPVVPLPPELTPEEWDQRRQDEAEDIARHEAVRLVVHDSHIQGFERYAGHKKAHEEIESGSLKEHRQHARRIRAFENETFDHYWKRIDRAESEVKGETAVGRFIGRLLLRPRYQPDRVTIYNNYMLGGAALDTKGADELPPPNIDPMNQGYAGRNEEFYQMGETSVERFIGRLLLRLRHQPEKAIPYQKHVRRILASDEKYMQRLMASRASQATPEELSLPYTDPIDPIYAGLNTGIYSRPSKNQAVSEPNLSNVHPIRPDIDIQSPTTENESVKPEGNLDDKEALEHDNVLRQTLHYIRGEFRQDKPGEPFPSMSPKSLANFYERRLKFSKEDADKWATKLHVELQSLDVIDKSHIPRQGFLVHATKAKELLDRFDKPAPSTEPTPLAKAETQPSVIKQERKRGSRRGLGFANPRKVLDLKKTIDAEYQKFLDLHSDINDPALQAQAMAEIAERQLEIYFGATAIQLRRGEMISQTIQNQVSDLLDLSQEELQRKIDNEGTKK